MLRLKAVRIRQGVLRALFPRHIRRQRTALPLRGRLQVRAFRALRPVRVVPRRAPLRRARVPRVRLVLPVVRPRDVERDAPPARVAAPHQRLAARRVRRLLGRRKRGVRRVGRERRVREAWVVRVRVRVAVVRRRCERRGGRAAGAVAAVRRRVRGGALVVRVWVHPRRADERRELLHRLRYDELGSRVRDGGVSRRRVVQRGVRRLWIGMMRRCASARTRVGPVVRNGIRCT